MKALDLSIAGEINLDSILYGLPEVMPVQRELRGTDFQRTQESSSAILAHNLAILGAQVGFRGGEVRLARLRGARGWRDLYRRQGGREGVGSDRAGDSFNAGFLFGWLQGWAPAEFAFAGNITGALSTLRVGGTEAFRDKDLVQSFRAQHSFPGKESKQ